MATNIQHNVVEVSTTPTNGQPWKFSRLDDYCTIPKVIAQDRKLSHGARLLWGAILKYSFRSGECFASNKTLGNALGISERQCIRYSRELESAGLLRTTQRAGKTPIRELLWDGRFAAKTRKTPVLSVLRGGQIRQGGMTDPSATYKEDILLSNLLSKKTATIEKVQGSEAPSSPVRKPPPERTDEEIIRGGRACGFPEHVIQRDLERARARRARLEGERMLKAAECELPPDSSIPR